jgi:gluconokinase
MKVPGLRSSYEKVGGIVYFGRMLDKIRLQAAGRLPDGYNLGTKVWTWFDARCTRFLGVDYEKLAQRVLAGGSDEDILAWCFEHGRRPSDEDIEIWNEFMMKRGWRDSVSGKLAEAKRSRGFAQRDDIQTSFDFHLADESSDDPPADIQDSVIHASSTSLQLRPDVPGVWMWAVSLRHTMLTYFEVQPHSRFESHSHESEQITMVLSGELFFEVQGAVHAVKTGEVIAIPSAVPHAVWTEALPVTAVDAWSPVMKNYQ